MKKAIKIVSVILCMLIAFESSVTAMAATNLKSKYTNKTYTHQTKFDGLDISYGIDVSQHNGDINFNKVKADGIDFAFVRVGYTGYTKSSFSLNYDKMFRTYIPEAIDAGLNVGVYWYSQALTTAEAVAEASKLLKAIRSYNITMPVVFDYEFACTSAGRLDSAKLSKARMTENALAFLDTVSAAGYGGCLYASENFLLEHMNADEVSSLYPIWLANYSTKTSYEGDFEYWQHTASGSVSGIKGNVDVNFRYTGEFTELENQAYTGQPIMPQPTVMFNGRAVIKDVDYTLSYMNNVNVGYAYVDAIGIGQYSGYNAKYRFKITPQRVEGLTSTGVGKDSMSYTWTPVFGASQYRLYITNNTNENTFTKTVSTNSAVISGLTQGNEYTVTVCAGAKNSDSVYVWGEYSLPDTRTTLGSEVTGLRVKSSSASAIRLTWNRIENCQLYVIYIYRERTKRYEEIARVTPATGSYKVDGLTSGKTYKFRVSAIKDNVEGKKSNYLKAAVKPNKNKVKSAKNTSPRRITVKWSYTNATGYQVQWSTKKSFSSNYKTVTVGKNTFSKTVKTAQSRKKYYVRTRAYTKANGVKVYGKWSSPKAVYVRR